MHGLANILSDNPSLQHTNELQEFIEVLSSIHDGLHQSIHPEGIESSTNTVARVINNVKTPPPLADRPRGMKRKRSTILLPPSPEIRQMRKNSHAPL